MDVSVDVSVAHHPAAPRSGCPEPPFAPPGRRLVLPGGRRLWSLERYPWPLWCAGACGRDLNRTPDDIYLEPGRLRLRCRCRACDLVWRVGGEVE